MGNTLMDHNLTLTFYVSTYSIQAENQRVLSAGYPQMNFVEMPGQESVEKTLTVSQLKLSQNPYG